MKRFELIDIQPVSIDVGLKKFENLAKGSQRGARLGVPTELDLN